MNMKTRPRTAIALLLALGLTVSAGLAAQSRETAYPEYKELVAAFELKDAGLRLKELERIGAAYPDSPYKEAIEGGILQARTELAKTLEAVLAVQREFMANGEGPARIQKPVIAAAQLLAHPRLGTFNAPAVLEAVLKYKGMAREAAEDVSSYEGIPQNQRDPFKSQVLNAFELMAAKAYLNAGIAPKALETLESYRRSGGATGGDYYHTLAVVKEKMSRIDEAYDAFLTAAVEEFEDSADRARALYVKIHGRPDGFEAALEAKSKALPFHAAAFEAPADWKGKAVLAELFTGSECPPCVGVDIAFDGLAETIPAKYLAVLVYHLPIPRPDPMMNPATEARQGVYGVDRTPTVIIDGINRPFGGGARGAAEGRYAQYRAVIEPSLTAVPVVSPKVRASLAGDTVNVSYDFDRTVPGAEYHLVLVQNEQEHKGGNGIAYHRMVVRDLLMVDPAGPRAAVFDLAASEKATDAYLTEFEKAYPRTQGFKWDVRRNVLPRTGLKVVFFIQEKDTKKVLNAVVADVK